MHSKNNRTNHDFQIAYFLAGSCHTPDGAYALLCDLQENREMALAQLESSILKEKAAIIKAQRLIDSKDEVLMLEGEAELAEIKNNKKFNKRNIIAAKKELDFINKCIEKLQPYRVYSYLPDDEAHEAMQQEEWKLELISRAENHLLTTGTISADHFIAMRQHPEFFDSILPAIENTKLLMSKSQNHSLLINTLNDTKINIPKLLESSDVRKSI